MNKHLAIGLLTACVPAPVPARAQGVDGTLFDLAPLEDRVHLARGISEAVLHGGTPSANCEESRSLLESLPATSSGFRSPRPVRKRIVRRSK